jgi:hypothetical protein
LTTIFPHDKRELGEAPDKAKPSARRGQKATGLTDKDGRATEGTLFGMLGRFICTGEKRGCCRKKAMGLMRSIGTTVQSDVQMTKLFGGDAKFW